LAGSDDPNVVYYAMTLQEASRKFTVAGLDESALATQEDAFATCLAFIEGIAKIKGQNRRHTSYGLKHIVEHPGGHFGIPSSTSGYHGFIYEGIFNTCGTSFRLHRRTSRQPSQRHV
jgi:hypothetical protein